MKFIFFIVTLYFQAASASFWGSLLTSGGSSSSSGSSGFLKRRTAGSDASAATRHEVPNTKSELPLTIEGIDQLDDSDADVDGLKLWQSSATVNSRPAGTSLSASSALQQKLDDFVNDVSGHIVSDMNIANVSGVIVDVQPIEEATSDVILDVRQIAEAARPVMVDMHQVAEATLEEEEELPSKQPRPSEDETVEHSSNVSDGKPLTDDSDRLDGADASTQPETTVHYSWEANLIKTMVDCDEHERPCIAHCRYGEESRHSWSECVERCVKDGLTQRLLLAGLPAMHHDAVHLDAEVPAGIDDLKKKKKRARAEEL